MNKGGNMKIYRFFNNIHAFRNAEGVVIDEAGEVLATHISSNESWSRHDLGMNGECDWKHNIYDKTHPNGWN